MSFEACSNSDPAQAVCLLKLAPIATQLKKFSNLFTI